MSYPIPDKVFESHSFIGGKTGAGKSYALRGMVELLLDQKKRVCIVDPKGDWYGIKSSADGKSKGYPLVIFGDQKVHLPDSVPINPRVGKEIAELVVTGNRPCVLGFRGWMPGDRTRFWIDFASTLFNKNTAPLYLVMDEVHNFAPQGKVLDPEAGKCLHWTNRIATEGRGNGIRLLMASQRPQKVHKDTLTCAETLIAMRVIHKLDRDSFKDWIDGAGDPERGKMVLNSLAEMPRGEAFVWYPEGKFFDKIRFPKIKTFDSFRSPTGDEKQHEPKGWADVDLDEVKEKLSSVIEETKANDPEELRKQIRDLKKQLLEKHKPLPVKASAGFDEKRLKLEVEKIAKSHEKEMRDYYSSVKAFIVPILKVFSHLKELKLSSPPEPPRLKITPLPLDARTLHEMDKAREERRPVKVPETVTPSKLNGELTNPEQRIIDAIAWLNSIGIEAPEQPAVAFLAGYRYGGGAFNNPRGALRSKGLVEYVGNRIKLTESGESLANIPAMVLTSDELHRKVMDRLPTPEQRVLKPLLEVFPESMSNEALAEAAGYVVNTGGFNNPRGRLRTLGLIEYKLGQVVAKSLLFIE